MIGAGISGLAAATWLAAKHIQVKLYEASTNAGGRCRTSRSNDVGEYDHGLHLVHANDNEFLDFLARIDARDRIQPVALKRFARASIADYANLLRLAFSDEDASQVIDEENPLYDAALRPLARLLLHTPEQEVSARALWRALRKRNRFFKARHSLQGSFIDPALQFLEYCGGSVYFGHALQQLAHNETVLHALHFGRKKIALSADDVVILATPPDITARVFPLIDVPTSHSAITLHYAAEHDETLGFYTTQDEAYDAACFSNGRIRITIRVADGAWYRDKQALAEQLWHRLRKQYPRLPAAPDGFVLWREKYAGHRMDAASMAREATPMQPHPRCLLADDWLNPKQPASLESAAASGHAAAKCAASMLPMQRTQRSYT